MDYASNLSIIVLNCLELSLVHSVIIALIGIPCASNVFCVGPPFVRLRP